MHCSVLVRNLKLSFKGLILSQDILSYTLNTNEHGMSEQTVLSQIYSYGFLYNLHLSHGDLIFYPGILQSTFTTYGRGICRHA